ncbi:MAG TPA: hypothetical protein VFR67_23430 [Pilimelia sp.]|nr:hypothetical protein [Pilimelia sp.]
MDVTGISPQLLAVVVVAVGGVVLVGLGWVARAQSSRPASAEPVSEPVARIDLDELRAGAQELAAHAALARERAGQAGATAWELRERAAAAAAARDAAWQVQERAADAYREALRAALAGRHPGVRRPGVGDGGERDRAVSRAALSAYRRGDISVEQLREVWRRTGGWDPRQDERERAAEKAGLAERAARRGFDRAAAEARRAGREARVAEIAAQALADEAVQAAAEAHDVMLAVQALAPRQRRWRRGSPRLAR